MSDSMTTSWVDPDAGTRIDEGWRALVARTHPVGPTSGSTEAHGRGLVELSRSELAVAPAPVTVIPRARRPHLDYGFTDLKRWQGTVLDIDRKEGVFWARLRDIGTTAPDDQVLEVDLLIEEVSEDDLPLLRVGAVFYWTIGYRSSLPNGRGTRIRASVIRFRRLPPPRIDRAAAQKRAAETQALFTDIDDDFASS